MENKDNKLNRRAESIKHLVSKVMPNFHFPQQCLDFSMWPSTESDITVFVVGLCWHLVFEKNEAKILQ